MYLALFRSELMRETDDEVFILIQAMNIIRRKDLRYVPFHRWEELLKNNLLVTSIDWCMPDV